MRSITVVLDTVKLITCLCLVATLDMQAAWGETRDVDGDGVVDTVDQDDDNDGIPDRIELTASGAERDSDLDGIPDRLDLDSDNDGVLDVQESGVFLSVNFGNARVLNGRILSAVGDNGLVDFLETFPDSNRIAYRLQNTDEADGDVVPDYLDLDSDNDGIPDLREVGVSLEHDKNRDGRIDAGDNAVGNDGILDAAQLNNDQNCCDYDFDGVGDLVPRNTDGGDLPDFQDLDSDNDGVLDLIEAGGTDLDQDGRIDDFFDDANSPDGVDDGLAVVPLPVPDSNGDGVEDYRDSTVQYSASDSNSSGTGGTATGGSDNTDSGQGSSNPEPSGNQDNSSGNGTSGDGSTNSSGNSSGNTNSGTNQPQDDSASTNPVATIATGLNGGAGCSIDGRSRAGVGFDPLFLVLLLCATLWLARRQTPVK